MTEVITVVVETTAEDEWFELITDEVVVVDSENEVCEDVMEVITPEVVVETTGDDEGFEFISDVEAVVVDSENEV